MISEHEQEWIRNVVQKETELIIKKLNNHDPQQLIELLSHRIVKKIIHPLTVHLNDCEIAEYDPVKSRQEYMDNYFNKFNRQADHVD